MFSIFRSSKQSDEFSSSDEFASVNRRIRRDNIYHYLFLSASIMVVALITSVFIFTASQTKEFLFHPDRLSGVLFSDVWEPTDNFDDGQFGSLPLLYGTFLVAIIAAVLFDKNNFAKQ